MRELKAKRKKIWNECMTKWILHRSHLLLGHRSEQGNPSVLFSVRYTGHIDDRRLTIEKGVEIVIIHFTQFEEVFASFWTFFNFEINDKITDRGFEENRHLQGGLASESSLRVELVQAVPVD